MKVQELRSCYSQNSSVKDPSNSLTTNVAQNVLSHQIKKQFPSGYPSKDGLKAQLSNANVVLKYRRISEKEALAIEALLSTFKRST